MSDITKKFLCMYLYNDLLKHDEIKLDKDSCSFIFLDKEQIVHTENFVPGEVKKYQIHIDYMIVEAKSPEEAKEKMIKGCNFQIMCCLCEESETIMRLFRKGTKTII